MYVCMYVRMYVRMYVCYPEDHPEMKHIYWCMCCRMSAKDTKFVQLRTEI